MTNRDMFQRLYAQKLNKEDNYQKILAQIEAQKQPKFMHQKWIIGVVCAVLLVGSVIVLSRRDPSLESEKQIININQREQPLAEKKIDAVTVEITSDQNGCLSDRYDANALASEAYTNDICVGLSNLKLPADLISQEKNYALYAENDSKDADDHQPLQYEKKYTAVNSKRSIIIRYAYGHKLMHDYCFENGEASLINQQQVFIYQYENSYMAKISNFDKQIMIETTDISEAELIDLLQSIITNEES